MQVVIDSHEFKKLVAEVEALQSYSDEPEQYDTGVRDGRNEAIVQIVERLNEFWNDMTT